MERAETAETAETAAGDWREQDPEGCLPRLVSLITGEGYEETPVPRLQRLARHVGLVLSSLPDAARREALESADLLATLSGRPLFKVRVQEVLERPSSSTAEHAD